MPRTALGIIIFLVVVFSAVPPVFAYGTMERTDFWDKTSFASGNVGFIGRGKLRVGGEHYDTQPGFTLGIKLDFLIRDRVYWGVSADVHRIHVRDTGQYFLDLSLHLKKLLFSSSSLVGFRPGVALGFGHLTHFREVSSSTYLTARATLEVIFFSDAMSAWFVEVGLMAAPVGGNSDLSVTFGPVPIIRLGAMF